MLTAVAAGLGREPSVRLDSPPRLADFARWAVATEPGFGLEPGQFMRAYAANRGAAHELALDSSVLARWLQQLVAASDFSGRATELLQRLNRLASHEPGTTTQKGWPRSPGVLSNILRRLKPNLQAVGIMVDFDRENDRLRGRMITIRNAARGGSPDGQTGPQPAGASTAQPALAPWPQPAGHL
jgi:hypothetical protein